MLIRPFKLGVIINPYAGIGGELALKGSDGVDIRTIALAQGAELKAVNRTKSALQALASLHHKFEVFTGSGDMGADLCRSLHLKYHIVYSPKQSQTEAEDTEGLASRLLEEEVDLILFAGGDGTARNVCKVIGNHLPVIGVPAGVKIHSGVYAITPQAAGHVVAQVIKGELVSVTLAEIRDIDEDAFRKGNVIAKYYGEMQVPLELNYIQAVKMGGKESDELVLLDIAASVIEQMDELPDTLFVMGSGSTVDFIMQELALPNTLLGIDVIKNKQLVASDVTAAQLISLVQGKAVKIVITLIGGQGHILGRGNQQLSPSLLKFVGKQNIIVVATKTKLKQLEHKPLLVDTGDVELNQQLAGIIAVTTGYKDEVLMRIGESKQYE